MEAYFSITISLRTHQGIETFASFSIGDNRDIAYAIFQQLKGNTTISETDVLFMEFIETINGLPANLKIISCTLEQLSQNCRIITREFFKFKNIHFKN